MNVSIFKSFQPRSRTSRAKLWTNPSQLPPWNYHECQLASTWSNLESQKSSWAAAQRALEVEGQNTVADLRSKIARLEQQGDSHNAPVEPITIGHQTELETERSRHHHALQKLTDINKSNTTSLTEDLAETRNLATRLETELYRVRNVNQLLGSSKARLDGLKSCQSTTILVLKAKLEATSNQLKNILQKKASVQDRLAAVEGKVESIRTRLDDAEREHTAVVRQKDDMIRKKAETMSLPNTLSADAASFHLDLRPIDDRLEIGTC